MDEAVFLHRHVTRSYVLPALQIFAVVELAPLVGIAGADILSIGISGKRNGRKEEQQRNANSKWFQHASPWNVRIESKQNSGAGRASPGANRRAWILQSPPSYSERKKK